MGIGILALQGASQEAPGTCLFEPVQETNTASLKRDARRPDIVLQPQPTDDARDPLNWSNTRKEIIYLILLWGTIMAGVNGPAPSPAVVSLTVELGISLTAAIAILGLFVLSYGIASGVVVVGCTLTGKRLWYVVGAILSLAGNLWNGAYTSYATFLASRVLQGLGCATFGCLANATINDIWFLHQTGSRVAFWHLAWNGSISLCPIISGIIYQRAGIRVVFWIIAACQGLVLIGTLLFLPETTYQRQAARSVGEQKDVPVLEQDGSSDLPSQGSEKDIIHTHSGLESVTPPSSSSCSKLTTGLGIYYKQDRQGSSITTVMVRPVVILFTPSVAFACVCYMLSFTWFVILSSLSSPIYSLYGFNAAQVGYAAGASQVVGCLISLVSSGPILDGAARYLSLRNNGFFEPEMRLVLLVPAFFSMLIGTYGLAFSLDQGLPWIAPTIFFGFISAGAGYGLTAAISYSTDSYPKRGGDTLGIILLVKGIFAWGATLYIGDWFVFNGPVEIFVTLGSLNLGIFLVGAFMYMYGKRLRAWSARSFVSWAL